MSVEELTLGLAASVSVNFICNVDIFRTRIKMMPPSSYRTSKAKPPQLTSFHLQFGVALGSVP